MNIGRQFTERYVKMMFASLRNGDDDQIQAEIEHCQRENQRPVRISHKFKKQFEESTYHGDGYEMQVFSTTKHPDARRLVVYYHGGAFIYQPVFFHWRFINDIAIRLHCRVVMPIYPKIPDYRCEFSNTQLLHFYRDCIQKQDVDEIILMGDSAGGNLALLQAQLIRENGYRKPDKLFLLSPCLDLSYANEADMRAREPFDPMLKTDRVKTLTDIWRQGLPATHHWASPVFGDLNGLGHITIFVGTHEILHTDSVMLRDKLIANNIDFNFYEYEGMFHTFPLFPVPEGFHAIRRMVKEIEPKKK